METPFIFAAAGLASLNAVKAAITQVHLVKNIGSTDVYATITGALSVANDTVTAGDMSIAIENSINVLTIAAKSALTKTNDSEQYYVGTATSGTTATLIDSGAAWPDYSGKVVHLTEGTNVGESAKVLSNTATTLTFAADAFTSAIDATSKFVILDDLSIVYTDGTQVVAVFEETTDKAISAASADVVNISLSKLEEPVASNKVG